MENRSRKRLSILKKPCQDDAPTTPNGTKSNRRISFSDRKSVKEFMAGEDKATIWGTSYEEEENGILAANQDPAKTRSFIAPNSSALISNPLTIGMQLRNKKIISACSSNLPPELDKENIMIIPENSSDTVDVTESIQFGACSHDNRTFNATVDITLNAFELRNCKFESAAQARLQTCNIVKPNESGLDISSVLYTSSIININEKEREFILQNERRNENKTSASVLGIRDQFQSDSAAAKGGDQRQTLIFNNTQVLDESLNTMASLQTIAPAQSSSKSRKQTLIFDAGKDCDMQIETDLITIEDGKTALNKENSSTSALRRQVNRQTLILDQKCDIDETLTESNQREITGKSLPVNRKTMIFGQENELEQSQAFDSKTMQDKATRQTIFYHDGPDLDVSNTTTSQHQSIAGNSVKQKKDRPTLLFKNSDLDLSIGSGSHQSHSLILDKKVPEQIPDQNISIFERVQKKRSNENRGVVNSQSAELPPKIQRRTIIFDKTEKLNEDHPTADSLQPTEKNRRTVLFDKECNDLELSMGNTNTIKNCESSFQEKSKQRRTVVFEKPESMEETQIESSPADCNAAVPIRYERSAALDQSVGNLKSVTMPNEEQLKSSVQNRQTILFNKSTDLDLTIPSNHTIVKSQQPAEKNRQTVLFEKDSSDLDLTIGNTNESENYGLGFQKESKQRRTVVFEKPENVDETLIENSPTDSRKRVASTIEAETVLAQRKTHLFGAIPFQTMSNASIPKEEKKKNQNRQTILFNKSTDIDLPMPSNHAIGKLQQPKEKNRQTVLFENESNDLDLTIGNTNTSETCGLGFQKEPKQRRTVVFEKPENLDETLMENSPTDSRKRVASNVDAETVPMKELLCGAIAPLSMPNVNILNEKKTNSIQNRQTILFNKSTDLDLTIPSNYAIAKSQQPTEKNRQTVLFGKERNDLELTMGNTGTSKIYGLSFQKQSNQRRTVVFEKPENVDETLLESSPADSRKRVASNIEPLCVAIPPDTSIPNEEKQKNSIQNRQTILFNKSTHLDLTMPSNLAKVGAQTANQRRTIIFDNPESLDETLTELSHFDAVASSQSTSKVRQLDDMEVDNDLNAMANADEDRSTTTALSWPSLKVRNPAEKQFIKNRQTLLLDQKCDIDESLTDFQTTKPRPEFTESARKTIAFDQSLDLEPSTSLSHSPINDKIVLRTVTLPTAYVTPRQTIVFNEGNDLDLTMETGSPFESNEIKNPIVPVERKTLVFNKTVTVDQSLCDRPTHQSMASETIITEEITQCAKRNRPTILFSKAVDLDFTVPSNQTDQVAVETVEMASQRRTAGFDDPELLEESSNRIGQANASVQSPTNPQPINANEDSDMDVETNLMDVNDNRSAIPVAQHSLKNRQTLIFDEKCNMDETLSDFQLEKPAGEITEKSLQVKASLTIEETQLIGSNSSPSTNQQKTLSIASTNRQTIFFNQGNNLDLTIETDEKNPENRSQSILTNSIKRMKYRQSILSKKNNDLSSTLENEMVLKEIDGNVTHHHQSRSAIFDRTKTAENNLSILERIRKNPWNEGNSGLSMRRQQESQRRTIIFDKNEKLEEDHHSQSVHDEEGPIQKNRKTVLFGKESNDLDLTVGTSITPKNDRLQQNSQPRRTVIFETDENLDETNQPKNFTPDAKSVEFHQHEKFNEENNIVTPKIFKNIFVEDQSDRNTSMKKTRETVDDVVVAIDETISDDCSTQNNRTRSAIDISGIENLDYITRNHETLPLINSITMRSRFDDNFENNSPTTTNINPQMFRKLTRDSIYLSKTAHCRPAAAASSLHTTPSSSAYSLNTTEALCNIDPSKITGTGYKRSLVKIPDSDDDTYGFKEIQRDYGEVTMGDDMGSNSSYDNIEKTHITLVDSPAPSAAADISNRSQTSSPPVCNASQVLLNNSGAENNVVRLNLKNTSKQDEFCRKCKNCRRSINFNDDTTIADFALDEDMESLTLNFDCLKKLKGKPRIIDVLNEIKDRRDQRDRRYSDSFNSDESITFPTTPSIEFLLKNYSEGYMQELKEETRNSYLGAYCPLIPTFEFLFKNKLETEKCNWHFNDLHLPAGLFECRHKTIRSIRLLIHFTAPELFKPNASKLDFNKITLSRCPIFKNLTPLDRIIQNDIFTKLPCDLTAMCNSNNELFDFLNRIHVICINSHELGKSLCEIAVTHGGFLRSDESGKCTIKKTVQDPLAGKLGIKKLQIHVRDIEKLAWHDIEVPDICRFSRHIESLPIGLDFVATFLSDPVKYFE